MDCECCLMDVNGGYVGCRCRLLVWASVWSVGVGCWCGLLGVGLVVWVVDVNVGVDCWCGLLVRVVSM